MNSVAAMVAFLDEELNGILELCSKNSMVSDWMTAHIGSRYML